VKCAEVLVDAFRTEDRAVRHGTHNAILRCPGQEL
jgi:hypothetical protein